MGPGLLNNRPGTYVVIYRSSTQQLVSIGKLGKLRAAHGYYLYLGSAFGPGGIAGRVARHLQSTARLHWHIDYLKCALQPIEVGVAHDTKRREHAWANCLQASQGVTIPLPRFGASDCRCPTHLFFAQTQHDLKRAVALLRGAAEDFSTYQPMLPRA